MFKQIRTLHIMALLFCLGTASAWASEVLSLADLGIPEDLGKVEERFQGETDYWVVHIQDVHAHFAAQENIAAIVDHLNHTYGVETVALEGAWSSTSFKKSWGLPSSREKQMLARGLLEIDYLNGSAYAALFSKTPIELVGIEDQSAYEVNRQLFLKHLERRDETIAALSEWRDKINKQKKRVFNPALLEFDQHLTEFREGKNAEKFIPHLFRLSRNNQVNLSGLDQMVIFEKILTQENAMDKDKLKKEASRLMKQFKKERLNFEELLRSGKISNEKMSYYPATTQYLELLKLQDLLDTQVLFDQMDDVIARVKKKLTTNALEQELEESSSRQQLIEKMLLLKSTPRDFQKFQEEKMTLKSMAENRGLDQAMAISEGFYTLAKKRDDHFFRKISEDQTLQKNIALVTGGFHTDGIIQKLRKAGISYLVITPDLAEQEANEELYFKNMLGNVPGTQTLETPREETFISPRFDDSAFEEGMRILNQPRPNLATAIDAVTSTQRKAPEEIADKALTANNFMKIPDDKQRQIVESWLTSLPRISERGEKIGPKPLVVLIKESYLQEMFITPVARIYFNNHFAIEKMNKLAVIKDLEIHLDELVGITASVQSLPFNTQIPDILRKRFSRDIRNKIIVVVGPEDLEGVVVLPVHPLSLYLARVIRDGRLSGENISVEFLNTISDRLTEIFTSQGIFQQSA